MRSRTNITTILGAAILAAAVYGREPVPTTAPTTSPAAFSLQGQVKIDGGFDLQKPDLSRAVVYLDSDPVLDAMPHPTQRPTVAQQNKAFVPSLLVIPKGTVVEFPNWDHFSHNVFSRSSSAPPFDLDRYPYGQSKSRPFDNAGIVQVFCNIHPFMKAVIFVAPNAFATRADADGRFDLKNVPPGQYQLCVWQERCQDIRQPVTVSASAPADTAITLHESRSSIFANDPPRHGGAYGIDRGLGIKQEHLGLPVVADAHPAPTTSPASTTQCDCDQK